MNSDEVHGKGSVRNTKMIKCRFLEFAKNSTRSVQDANEVAQRQ